MRLALRAAGLMCLMSLGAHSDAFEEYLKQQQKAQQAEKARFEYYKEATQRDFEDYQKALDEAFAEYKESIAKVWKDPQFSTQKEWVSYTEDKQTRTAVAFDRQEIVIETIASSQAQAEANLKTALARVVTEDTAQVQKRDPWMKKAKSITASSKGIVKGKVRAEPLLSTAVFKKQPTPKSVKSYVNAHVGAKPPMVTASKIKGAKVYKISVKLPSDTMQKRSRNFLGEVKKNSKRFDLPVPLVFAIMHTESAFNPFAKSHIPAYGLMQIVPSSAGEDTYLFLHKKRKRPSSTYLYDSRNNIEMGSAYLHILYYRYLRKITNPQSRLFCTIAAYNTGAGNVAWAWTGNYNISKASGYINKLDPAEVYTYLIQHLKYDEPKHYLDRVNKRMDMYHKLYGDDTSAVQI